MSIAQSIQDPRLHGDDVRWHGDDVKLEGMALDGAGSRDQGSRQRWSLLFIFGIEGGGARET